MLTLPAGIITLNPSPQFSMINQRMMRHIADESQIDLNHPKIKDFETILISKHLQSDKSDLTKPFGIFTNSILENKPTLFLLVPVYSDQTHSKMFLFAFKREQKFPKEEILYNTDVWHNINNPLAILMLASEKAEGSKEILKQKEIDKFFTIIKDVTGRINQLGDNFIARLDI